MKNLFLLVAVAIAAAPARRAAPDIGLLARRRIRRVALPRPPGASSTAP